MSVRERLRPARRRLAVLAVAALTLVAPGGVSGEAQARPTIASTAAAPGAGGVVRSEALGPDLVLTRASSATHFEYVTTGPQGGRTTSLGTVYLPKGKVPAGGWPVVAYGHGTAGLSDEVVSYTGWVGEDNTGDAYLGKWLDAGFAVAATEYPGIGTAGVHPYLNTRSEGASMIDVVRAARTLEPSLSRTWVAHGYSQGGHAAMAAGAMAPEYAPELALRGVAAGGLPAGVVDEFALIRPDMPIGPSPDLTVYTAYVLAGFRAAYPDYPIERYLSPRGAQLLGEAEKLNYFDLMTAVGSTAPGEMVTRPLADGDFLSALDRHLGLPTRGYRAPVLIYQQALDVVSSAPFTARFADELRTGGADVRYRVDYSPQGHAAWDEALPEVLAFAKRAVR